MSLRGRRHFALVAVAATLLPFAVAGQPAAAVVYEAEPTGFCGGQTLHDYLAPLRRMPKLHHPGAEGRLGFGSANIALEPTSPLIVGGGVLGYRFTLHNYNHPAHPRWDVTATLSRVDWRGHPTRLLGKARRHVKTIGREHDPSVRFAVGQAPAAYRLSAVFRTFSGRKLGVFGFYFRVVGETRRARLGLNATAYRPGQTVFGRVEDFGTATAAYGVPYRIERLEGSTWTEAPESPKGPWILPLILAGPGASGPCDSFWIPPTTSPGRYRMSKQISFESRTLRRDRHPATLSGEFEVTP